MNISTITISLSLVALVGGGSYGAYHYLVADEPIKPVPVEEIKGVPNEKAKENVIDEPVEVEIMAEVDFVKIEQFLTNQQMAEVQDYLKAFLQEHPHHPIATILQAEFFYQENGDLNAAISLLENALKEYPESDELLVQLGVYYTEQAKSDYQQAVDTVEKGIDLAEKEGKEIPIAYKDAHAWGLALHGEVDRAITIYVEDIFQHASYTSNDPTVMMHFALILESMEDTAYAKQVYEDILTLNPADFSVIDQPDVFHAQANAHLGLERLTQN